MIQTTRTIPVAAIRQSSQPRSPLVVTRHRIAPSDGDDLVSMETRYASCEFLERQEKGGKTLYDSYICELILFEIYSFLVKNEW